MNIIETDIQETKKIADIIKFVESIDVNYFNTESDIIYVRQPFLISLIMINNNQFNPETFGEIIKAYLIIWEYFKDRKNISKYQICEDQFERILQRNTLMLKYYEGEPTDKSKLAVVSEDLGHLKSKALMTGLFYQFNTNPVLVHMDGKTRGIQIISMKTLIECFEEIENK